MNWQWVAWAALAFGVFEIERVMHRVRKMEKAQEADRREFRGQIDALYDIGMEHAARINKLRDEP